MTRRLVTTMAFAAATAFALAMATPAQACEQHKQTADTHKKADDKAATKASTKTDGKVPAAQDKKADASAPASTLLAAGCNCDKDGKNCTCPKGECKCPNCHKEKPDKPKARAA
jgi:Ni/Co efflux regulator RcnB